MWNFVLVGQFDEQTVGVPFYESFYGGYTLLERTTELQFHFLGFTVRKPFNVPVRFDIGEHGFGISGTPLFFSRIRAVSRAPTIFNDVPDSGCAS